MTLRKSRIHRISILESELYSIKQRSLHIFNINEFVNSVEFRERHFSKCNNGSDFIYRITGKGSEATVTIKCPVCGVEESLTDVFS